MKASKLLPFLALTLALVIGCSKSDTVPVDQTTLSSLNNKITGNGAPSGTHYNLNIIGVRNDKDMTADESSGHVIFVPLVGKTKILLSEGEYAVLDKNGTDGEASFQLPNPDPDNDGVTVYSVWARGLGKPGGSASMVTGAIDPGLDGILGTADDVIVYSMYTLTVERGHGKQIFQDVSKELLYIYVETDITDADGNVLVKAGRYPLFDDALEGYFWEYDNNGLKLLQLRFYEVPSTVPAL